MPLCNFKENLQHTELYFPDGCTVMLHPFLSYITTQPSVKKFNLILINELNNELINTASK